METVVPKLVAEDIPLLNSLLSDVFPGIQHVPAEMTRLREEIAKVCAEMFLVYACGEESGAAWVDKVRMLCHQYLIIRNRIVIHIWLIASAVDL